MPDQRIWPRKQATLSLVEMRALGIRALVAAQEVDFTMSEGVVGGIGKLGTSVDATEVVSRASGFACGGRIGFLGA